MLCFERKNLMQKFQQMAREHRPIIGGGAGTGLSAKCEELGGIDLIIIYNSGRYRMAGRGSLAGLLSYGNANDIVVEMAREVLPVVKKTPVLAGVNGTDPFCLFDSFLDDLLRMGFSGVQNFPTVGLIDGVFRANLEETGMGYALEVDMIRLAHQKGLFTTPYIFDEHQAVAMTEAGADILVAHMGLTTGGSIGAETTLSLDDCIQRINRIATAAMQVRPDILVLCHGGPIATPADAQYILESCPNCHGFFGASSMERLPTEESIIAQTRAFKAIEPHSTQEIEMPHKIHVRETIKAPIEKIWDIIGPFNGLPAYHPAIQASYIEDNKGDGNTVGSIRYLTLDDGFVREKLLKFDPKTYTFEYAIIEGSLPVENYQAGVRLSSDKNNHTLCEWWADFTITKHPAPEELVEMIAESVFRAGFQAAAQVCNAYA